MTEREHAVLSRRSEGSLEKHESRCSQTAALDHSSPKQIATAPLKRGVDENEVQHILEVIS